MDIFSSGFIIPAAFALDLIMGDPSVLPHPIRMMGRAITSFESAFRNIPMSPFVSGALYSMSLILLTWLLSFTIVAAAYSIHPVAGLVLEVIFIYYCISVRSLEKAAMDVYQKLFQGNIKEAREKVSFIVGREVENLDEADVSRAAVETVAENFVDGVVSPVLFAFIGGAPLAMAFKMINTLDSMVGYKNDKYILFGKASARIDDVVNFLPARLAVPVISLAAQILTGKGRSAFRTALKEGKNHTSPNAGYPEASFAGAIGVKLGGPNHYHGRLVPKPYIGTRFGDADKKHIKKACDLMVLSSFLLIALIFAVTLLF
jgi:adenosylcobinamide-phosphate synthase